MQRVDPAPDLDILAHKAADCRDQITEIAAEQDTGENRAETAEEKHLQ